MASWTTRSAPPIFLTSLLSGQLGHELVAAGGGVAGVGQEQAGVRVEEQRRKGHVELSRSGALGWQL